MEDKDKKIPEEKKVSLDDLMDVSGGKGIKNVVYTETVDISEDVKKKI